MSEFLAPVEHPSRLRTLVAPLMVGVAMVASCTQQEATPPPDMWQVSIPSPESSAPSSANEACAEPDATIAPFAVDPKLAGDYDNIYSKGARKYLNAEPLNAEEAFTLLEDLKEGFGISLTFPEQAREDALYTFGPIEDDPAVREAAITRSISGVAEALTLFSPEVIKALNLTEIAYVDGIKRKPGFEGIGIDVAGGLYDPHTNTIYIDVAAFGESGTLFGETIETVVHELAHAIDEQLLCSGENIGIDPSFTKFNSRPYQGYKDDGNTVDTKLTRPNPQREYANAYATSGVAEDRATIVESLLTNRGLVLPGDPDAESPYARKQAEIVRRLEKLAPGFTQFASLRTLWLRQGAAHNYAYDGYGGIDTELDLSLQTAAYPDELLSSVEFGDRAIKEGKPLEILTNGVLEITQPYVSEPLVIKHPIIYRGPDGEITGVMYTDRSSVGLNPGEGPRALFESHFFDTTRMKLRFDGDQAIYAKGPLEVTFDIDTLSEGAQFASTNLAIAGYRTEPQPYDAGTK